jgi:hypothetical protein
MKGADFVWDPGKLDSFIAKPDEVVPGNNMKPYGGLASAEDRTKLIAFLQSTTHCKLPLYFHDESPDFIHETIAGSPSNDSPPGFCSARKISL